MNHIRGTDKSLCVGTALVIALVALAAAGTAVPAQAQYSVYSFTGGTGQAKAPSGLLVQGRDGNLYGYSQTGGAKNNGTLYEISIPPGAAPTVLYSFPSRDNCDLGLTLGTDGNFYGGCEQGPGTNLYGYVFQFIPGETGTGTFTILHTFTGQPDGANPSSRPVEGRDGNFYGTTFTGGENGYGLVYRITPTGTLTPLYSFTDDPSLSYPYGPLFLGSNGNLYGTTQAATGPPYPTCTSDCGAVYEITTAGELTRLHTFTGGPLDGATPTHGVIEATNGFYGTTVQGGQYGSGTIFRMGRMGDVTAFSLPAFFYSFANWDYGYPKGLTQASDGNFYGFTNGCKVLDCTDNGSIFDITPEAAFSWVHIFGGPPDDGASPDSTLSHTIGTLYGVTELGGTANDGVLYSLNVAAPEFCRPQVLAGQPGATIGILGQGFSASSSVTIGGATAAITSTEATYITVTVPANAQTGLVTVTTPGSQTLSSLQAFEVLPTITGFSPPSGPVGTPVTISVAGCGTRILMQAMKVTFGGVAAKFTVNSETQITAIVPAGAVTGSIEIMAPGGTAVSANQFTVTH